MNIGPLVAIVPVVLAVAMIILIIRRNVTGRSESISRDITAAIPAIVVLMVAALIIGSFASTADKSSYELYDCVPASQFGPDVSIQGDCAELVTIGGTEYVRMTDLGSFSVVYPDGSKKNCTVEKAHMDLVVWSGQSNSTAFTNPSFYMGETTVLPGQGFYLGQTEPADDENSGITRYDHVEGATVCDIVGDDGGMRVAQMYPAFYGDYIKETGHRLITASTGIGGMSIQKWNPGRSCDTLFKDVIETLKDQCEGKIEITPVAVLWVQGESDVDNTQEYYLEKFLALLQKMENGYFGIGFPHVLSSLPRNPGYTYSNMTAPALAQIQAQSLDSHFKVASSLAYRTGDAQHRDSVHFTQEYYGWVGEAFAREAAVVTGHQPVKQTIVLSEDPGLVTSLPSTVTGYGTSGEAFSLKPVWTESDVLGYYLGTLTRNPSGTAVMDGLEAKAWLPSTFDPSDGTLTIWADTTSYTWHGYAADVRAVVVEDGVTTLGQGMFDGSTGLEYVSIPSTTTTISQDAFDMPFKDAHDVAMTPSAGEYAGYSGSLYLCDPTVLTIESGAVTGLADATATHIVLPSTYGGAAVTSIGERAFENATIVMVSDLPGSAITTSGMFAFQRCTSLESATLRELTEVAANMFYGCTALTDLDVPKAEKMLYRSFFDCHSLTSFDLSAVTQTGNGTFDYCTAITEVVFGSGLTVVGTFASWTFYAADGTTVLDPTAANLAGHTFRGTASALVMQS